MTYPIPDNEDARLEELNKLNILDSMAEEVYDNITRMTADFFDAPIALISLVDEDRQWFKSVVGLDIRETSRDIAFCAYNISDKETMVVEDATQDERFKNNPLVTGDPKIRFYAGAPLKTSEDLLLGSLCIIDRKARSLTKKEKLILETFSKQISLLLQMRKVTYELRSTKKENMELKRLLPICSWCGDVRNDKEYWSTIEEYMKTQGKEFTHSICPNCSEKLDENLEFI